MEKKEIEIGDARETVSAENNKQLGTRNEKQSYYLDLLKEEQNILSGTQEEYEKLAKSNQLRLDSIGKTETQVIDLEVQQKIEEITKRRNEYEAKHKALLKEGKKLTQEEKKAHEEILQSYKQEETSLRTIGQLRKDELAIKKAANRYEEIVKETGELKQQTPNTPNTCLLYTSPSPRDRQKSRMPSSA